MLKYSGWRKPKKIDLPRTCESLRGSTIHNKGKVMLTVRSETRRPRPEGTTPTVSERPETTER